MLALRYDGEVRLAHVDRPTRRAGEARVAVRRAGVCSTDLEIAKGYMGFEGTLGHELVGEVLVRDPSRWKGTWLVPTVRGGVASRRRCGTSPPRRALPRTAGPSPSPLPAVGSPH